MEDIKFTPLQLREVAGLTEATYGQWRTRRFIEAEMKGRGPGFTQLFTLEETIRAALTARLANIGIAVSVAARLTAIRLHAYKDEPALFVVRQVPSPLVDGMDVDSSQIRVEATVMRKSEYDKTYADSEGCAWFDLNKLEQRALCVLNGEPVPMRGTSLLASKPRGSN